MQLLQPIQSRKMRTSVEANFLKWDGDLQRTKLRAAVRAYELNHGKLPVAARDLVPQYLKSIPFDPTTGKELPLDYR